VLIGRTLLQEAMAEESDSEAIGTHHDIQGGEPLA